MKHTTRQVRNEITFQIPCSETPDPYTGDTGYKDYRPEAKARNAARVKILNETIPSQLGHTELQYQLSSKALLKLALVGALALGLSWRELLVGACPPWQHCHTTLAISNRTTTYSFPDTSPIGPDCVCHQNAHH